jgi:hypothetical protein
MPPRMSPEMGPTADIRRLGATMDRKQRRPTRICRSIRAGWSDVVRKGLEISMTDVLTADSLMSADDLNLTLAGRSVADRHFAAVRGLAGKDHDLSRDHASGNKKAPDLFRRGFGSDDAIVRLRAHVSRSPTGLSGFRGAFGVGDHDAGLCGRFRRASTDFG